MIDWTDRYCRFFHRQLSAHARLYTEMIVDQAILRGDAHHLLDFDPAEHPVALQLGGSDPSTLAAAARIGAEFGYDEINLNVGCPSDRVQSGTFGACLMRTPAQVAEAVAAMQDAVDVPVTVKCRIGVDDQNPDDVLPAFLRQVIAAGAKTVIIHARKAWLQGLSPKENRTVPPLDYELVQRMASMFPDTSLVLNGGITDHRAIAAHLATFDGVMIGRAAYENPFMMSVVDRDLFGGTAAPISRVTVVEQTCERMDRTGVPLWRYARHMLGLFHGQPGARRWRQMISTHGRDADKAGSWLVELARSIAAQAEEVPA